MPASRRLLGNLLLALASSAGALAGVAAAARLAPTTRRAARSSAPGWRAIAQDERIPLLDVTPPLREATGALSWPCYDFDSHWNRLGHKIAGEQVDGFLRRQGWDCAR